MAKSLNLIMREYNGELFIICTKWDCREKWEIPLDSTETDYILRGAALMDAIAHEKTCDL